MFDTEKQIIDFRKEASLLLVLGFRKAEELLSFAEGDLARAIRMLEVVDECKREDATNTEEASATNGGS
jgi:hypothetical protein